MLIGKMTGNISTKLEQLYRIRSLTEVGPERELYAAYAKGIEIMCNVDYETYTDAERLLFTIRRENENIFEESFLLTENVGGRTRCTKCNHTIFYVIIFNSKKIQAYCSGCELAVHE